MRDKLFLPSIVVIFLVLNFFGCQSTEDQISQLRTDFSLRNNPKEQVKIIDEIIATEDSQVESILVRWLSDYNYRLVHSVIIDRLGQMRAKKETTLSSLFSKIEDPIYRQSVISALNAIGIPAYQKLIDKLSNEDINVFNNAAYAIRQLEIDIVPLLRKELFSDNPQVRRGILSVLADFGSRNQLDRECINDIIQIFSVGDLDQVIIDMYEKSIDFDLAVQAISGIGDNAKPLLISAIQSEDIGIQTGAALSLYLLDKKSKDKVLPILLQKLSDTHMGEYVGKRLFHFGISILPEIEEVFLSSKETSYTNASFFLESIGQKAIPLLVEGLNSPIVDKQLLSIAGLNLLGHVAKPARKELLKLFSDEQLGRNSAQAIVGILGKESVSDLIRLLGSKNLTTQKNAIFALGLLGRDGMQAIDNLEKKIKNKTVAVDACHSIVNIKYNTQFTRNTGNPMTSDTVGYARTQFTWDRNQTVKMYVRSDDGIKVWLNEELIWANNTMRALSWGEDVIKVKLKKGKNHLLLKVTQGMGTWGYEVRIGSDKKLISSGWKIIYPFDNVGNIGFDTVYPPEKETNFNKVYTGKNNVRIKWYNSRAIGNQAFSSRRGFVSGVKSISAQLKPIIQVLQTAIQNGDSQTRMKALETAAIVGDQAIPMLQKLIVESIDEFELASIASTLGQKAKPEVIIELMKNRKIKWNARVILYSNLTNRFSSSLANSNDPNRNEPGFGSELDHDYVENKLNEFRKLKQAKELVQSLETHLNTFDLNKKVYQFKVLGNLAVPFLIEQFASPVTISRGRAKTMLVSIGEPAVPELRKAVKQEKFRYWANLTLSDIKKKS